MGNVLFRAGAELLSIERAEQSAGIGLLFAPNVLFSIERAGFSTGNVLLSIERAEQI